MMQMPMETGTKEKWVGLMFNVKEHGVHANEHRGVARAARYKRPSKNLLDASEPSLKGTRKRQRPQKPMNTTILPNRPRSSVHANAKSKRMPMTTRKLPESPACAIHATVKKHNQHPNEHDGVGTEPPRQCTRKRQRAR
jgi:hypothetical protein